MDCTDLVVDLLSLSQRQKLKSFHILLILLLIKNKEYNKRQVYVTLQN